MSKKPNDKKPADDKPTGLAAINVNEVYPLPLFKQLTGQADWGMRQLRRRGLKVRYVGGKAFVRGRDWFDFLEKDEAE